MSPESNAKYITLGQVLSIIITILLLSSAAFFADMRGQISDLKKDKMDRTEYLKDYQTRKEDIAEIKAGICKLTESAERMKEVIIEHTAMDKGLRAEQRKDKTKTSWGVGK